MFIWNNSTPKLYVWIKECRIRMKITSLQCSCIKRLYDNNFHVWKIIAKYLVSKTFGRMFQILILRKIFWNSFQLFVVVSSIIGRPNTKDQTSKIKIDNVTVFFKKFSEHGINFAYQLFDKNGITKNGKFFKLNMN